MAQTLTVSGYNRPRYLEQTLRALTECDGIASCRVAVILDPCDETQEQGRIAMRYGFTSYVMERRAGCNTAIQTAIQYAFDHMGTEYHIHLEDDTVPTRDCLRWFAWAGRQYRGNPGVMNVSGYQRLSNHRLGECGLRRWFTPWGWATWKDRWAGLARGWAQTADVSWDVIVNHGLRAGRYEAFPTTSRIQNIGAELGTHVPNAEWHAANHHVPITADDLSTAASFPIASWKQTRVDDHADHA